MAFAEFLHNFILFTGTTMIGIFGAFFITSQFVYSKAEQIMIEEEKETIFEETYREEFDSLEKNEIPDKEIVDNFSSQVETPLGDVVMTYDLDKKHFNYYSNRRNIPVRFLDVVAQKFVIDHDCRIFYEEEEIISDTEEAENANDIGVKEPEPEILEQSYYEWATSFFWSGQEEKSLEEIPDQEEEKEVEEEKEESVFASYKKNPEVKAKANNIVIEKIMNTYKYKGTLDDYENTKKKEISKSLEISFTKFKEMVKNKTE